MIHIMPVNFWMYVFLRYTSYLIKGLHISITTCGWRCRHILSLCFTSTRVVEEEVSQYRGWWPWLARIITVEGEGIYWWRWSCWPRMSNGLNNSLSKTSKSSGIISRTGLNPRISRQSTPTGTKTLGSANWNWIKHITKCFWKNSPQQARDMAFSIYFGGFMILFRYEIYKSNTVKSHIFGEYDRPRAAAVDNAKIKASWQLL